MVTSIIALKLDDEILGVRVTINDVDLYDISINTYSSLGFDANILESKPLIPFGDVYVTEDEYMSGHLIKDGSNDDNVLREVKKSPLTGGKKNLDIVREQFLKKESAALKKKKEELRYKFSKYIPDRWLNEFVEYHIRNFHDNKNIYVNLYDNQKIAIQHYFRWRSKLLYDSLSETSILKVKPNKTVRLVELMGDLDDWVYDGTTDTGFVGGGYCTFGHALRYEHYATSLSTGRSIVFGSTCISDFFQVDEKIIKLMTKIQDELLSEVKCCIFIMETGKVDEYKELHPLLDEISSELGVKADTLSNIKGWHKHTSSFRTLGIPITSSMLREYKVIRDKYSPKLTVDYLERVEEVLKLAKDKRYPINVVREILDHKHRLVFIRIVRAILLTKDLDNKLVKQGVYIYPKLSAVANKLSEIKAMGIDIDLLIRQPKLHYYIEINGRYRLATKEEVKNRVKGLEMKTSLEKWKLRLLKRLIKDVLEVDTMNIDYTIEDTLSTLYYFEMNKYLNSFDELEKAINWGMTDNFIDEVLSLGKDIEQPDTAIDSLVSGVQSVTNPDVVKVDENIDKALKLIEDANRNGNLPIFLSYVMNIIATIRQTGRMSSKQRIHVVKAYKAITSKKGE